MNRRTFLLAMGASACGAREAPRRRRQRREAGSGSGQPAAYNGGLVPTIVTAWQRRASAVALRGDVVAQVAGTELRTYDARTLSPTETRDLAPNGFCFAQDGALVVYSHPASSPAGSVYRIGASRNLETFASPLLRSAGTVLLPGRTAAQFFVVLEDLIFPITIADGRVEAGQGLLHPAPNQHNRDQLVARDDGSLIVPVGGLRVLWPDGTEKSFAMTGRWLMHLVGASDDRVWYSHAPASAGATQLFLAKTLSPLAEEHMFDVSPLRISHLASGKGAAAVIGLELRGVDDVRWELIVFGEDGKERWRTALPEAFARRFSPGSSSLAINEKWVVISRYDSTLVGWDAVTGKPIA